jgi:flagellar biosynthetic protein FliR
MTAAALPNLADFSVAQVELGLLMFLRIATAVFLFPVLNSDEIPPAVKAGLSLLLTLLLFPTLPKTVVPIPDTVAGLFALGLKEVYVGLVLGFAGTLALAGLSIAGEWIDQETGFTMLQLFDPMTQQQTTAIGSLLLWLFTVLLLVSGGYLFFLQALADSFQVIPLTGARWEGPGMLEVLLRMTGDSFVFGLKAAAPVLAALFMSSLGLAIIARIMPQANVWMVGMPLKLLLGMLTVIYALPMLWQVFEKHYGVFEANTLALLHLMGR